MIYQIYQIYSALMNDRDLIDASISKSGETAFANILLFTRKHFDEFLS